MRRRHRHRTPPHSGCERRKGRHHGRCGEQLKIFAGLEEAQRLRRSAGPVPERRSAVDEKSMV